MLKKLLLASAALFLILLGSLILMMGYVFNHPESIFNAFNSVTAKFTQGEKYEEKEEYFLQGIRQLSIKGHNSSLQVIPYNGATLKIELTGTIPRFERGPFLSQLGDGEQLAIEVHEPVASNWVHININGQENTTSSDTALSAKIYLPQTYRGVVSFTTKKGNVELLVPKEKFYQLDLQSTEGRILNELAKTIPPGIQASEVGELHISTTSGNITVKNAF